MIGTWSIVALAGAAAVLIQIPYSLDELIATLQFLRRRARAGQNWGRLLFVGDTDEMPLAAKDIVSKRTLFCPMSLTDPRLKCCATR